jgi:hypothetical protein
MTVLGVHSEVGQLHQAILHRPGLELTRLTPNNIKDLLFDDIMWVKRARRAARARPRPDAAPVMTATGISSPPALRSQRVNG